MRREIDTVARMIAGLLSPNCPDIGINEERQVSSPNDERVDWILKRGPDGKVDVFCCLKCDDAVYARLYSSAQGGDIRAARVGLVYRALPDLVEGALAMCPGLRESLKPFFDAARAAPKK